MYENAYYIPQFNEIPLIIQYSYLCLHDKLIYDKNYNVLFEKQRQLNYVSRYYVRYF